MELHIPPKRIYRNPVNGRFLKGITPHNKGKKWEEWMDKETIERVRKTALKNLRPNYNLSANRRAVVALKDNKLYKVYPSILDAAHSLGMNNGSNISACCKGKRKHVAGLRWFYEEDNTWCDIVNKNKYGRVTLED